MGFKKKKSKPWITGASWKAIDDRKNLKVKADGTKSMKIKARLQDEYRKKDKEVKKKLRADKRVWMDNMMGEAEDAASRGQMGTLYSIVRTVCNNRARPSYAIRDKMVLYLRPKKPN